MASRPASVGKVLSVCLMVGGVAMLARTGYELLDRHYPHLIGRSPSSTPIRTTVEGSAAGPVTYSVSNIVSAHLFGHETKEKKAVVQQVVPETKLKLNLLGVLGSTSSDYARALIRVNSKQTKAYSIGEQIENTDAKIHTVEGHKVILDRGGKYESLMMARSKIDNIVVGLNESTATGSQPAAVSATGSASGSSSKSNSSVPF